MRWEKKKPQQWEKGSNVKRKWREGRDNMRRVCVQAVMSELVLEMKRVSLGDQTHRDATEALQLELTETRQRLVTAHYPQKLNFHLPTSEEEDASKHRSGKIIWVDPK